MFIFGKNKAFTLIELIIVIAVVSLIAAVSFIAINPTKRINDAKDAVRAGNALDIEKAIQNSIADNLMVPELLDNLEQGINYMIVTEGGSTAGTAECPTLNEPLARVNIASAFKDHLGNMPTDEEATGDDTGYYIKRVGDNFFCNHCHAYGVEYTYTPPCAGYYASGYCWYRGAVFGQSCDTVCSTHGGCVAENWNDTVNCDINKHFVGCDGMSGCDEGIGIAPPISGDSYGSWCLYRAEGVDQDCSATGGGQRLCACEN